MNDYQKFVVGVEALSAHLNSSYNAVNISWEYDTDYCVYRVLFEPTDEILGRKLYFRVMMPQDAISKISSYDIRLSLLNQYRAWNKSRLRILKQYHKHKIRERKKKNGIIRKENLIRA